MKKVTKVAAQWSAAGKGCGAPKNYDTLFPPTYVMKKKKGH